MYPDFFPEAEVAVHLPLIQESACEAVLTLNVLGVAAAQRANPKHMLFKQTEGKGAGSFKIMMIKTFLGQLLSHQ